MISPKKVDDNPSFYEAYGIIENMELSREDLKAAIDVLYDIIMKLNKEQRDSQYLFQNGLIVAKNQFIDTKRHESEFDAAQMKQFEQAQVKFRGKLEKLKPAVDFLIRLKEIL